jgi:chromosome segregation ATPase
MNNEEKIFKKLENHDEMFVKITNKLEDHDEIFIKINNKLENHDDKFDKIDKRFDKLENSVDLLAHKVVDIDSEVKNMKETMATKEDINKLADTLDYIVGKLDKNEQENVFGGNRVSRVEKKVEVHEEEIGNIKMKLDALPA